MIDFVVAALAAALLVMSLALAFAGWVIWKLIGILDRGGQVVVNQGELEFREEDYLLPRDGRVNAEAEEVEP